MNDKPNRGRALRPAAHRFASMLIEEVRVVTGMTYPEITHALFVDGKDDDPSGKAVDPDRAMEYTLPLTHRRARVPKFAELQALEKSVAELLKRSEHELVIEDRSAIDRQFDTFISIPKAGISWRRKDRRPPENLAVAYALGWPTYGELVEARLVDSFRWQYGHLWESGHFTRATYNFPEDSPIEILLENRVRRLTSTYYVLAGYMHMKYLGLPGAIDLPDKVIENIDISVDDLRLFCRAWAPLGLHRWRHLGRAAVTAAQAYMAKDSSPRQQPPARCPQSLSRGIPAGILPEICLRPD